MQKIDMFNNATPAQVLALKRSIQATNEALVDTKYKIQVQDAIVQVYHRSALTTRLPEFSVTFGETVGKDLYFKSDCGHDELAWCEHLSTFFARRMDRPLISMLVGRGGRLIVPVYPHSNFGLILDFKGQDESHEIELFLSLWKSGAHSYHEVGGIDHLGSVKTIKNMLEDLIYHIIETDQIVGDKCGRCERTITSPDFIAQDLWEIAVNGMCASCNEENLDLSDVVPDAEGQYFTSEHKGPVTGNRIDNDMADLKKFATSKFEGNTHGK